MPTPKAGLLDERCLCGNLLARVSADGIEVLCRRCKRVHRIPWPEKRKGVGASDNAAPVRG